MTLCVLNVGCIRAAALKNCVVLCNSFDRNPGCYHPLIMYFEILGKISNIETIAVGTSIQDIKRLRKLYGTGRWRKLKGIAHVHLPDGTVCKAEIHWYEAHGIGKKDMKIKRILE